MDGFRIFPTSAFSPERSAEVVEKTKIFLEVSGQGKSLEHITQAFSATWKLLPIPNDAILSGHTFPWIESHNDLQISYSLASMGFYKQSHSSLRSALELGLLAVYWNLEDNGPKGIKSWLKSKEDTPFSGEVFKRLNSHKNFRLFQESYDLDTEFSSLKDLHDFVHTKGAQFSNAIPFPENGKVRIASQRFSESSFKNWVNNFERVLRFLASPTFRVRVTWSRIRLGSSYGSVTF